ncbi:MAG: CidA/LrgA family protein [Hungatella sp.]|nr:CidA/LrgA family protein [Hungatella sp.]
MKYIRQFGIILLISLVGELLHQWLPLPIPASIYGIILLFLCLEWKVISLASVKEASSFLIEIMPIMFIPAAAGLMDSWMVIKTSWVSYGAITVISTVVVMAVSGRVVQAVMKMEKGKKKSGNEGEG